jgi:germacradienol/geosmin synthase
MGMLEPQPGLAGSHVWDEPKAAGCDLALCAAGLHPEATPEALDLASQWLAWGTYADDLYPAAYGRTRDLAGARAATDRLPLFMPLDDSPAPEPASALERGLDDLWQRTAGPMSERDRRAFRAAVEVMTDSWLWELANQAQNRIPDPVDYIEMRRHTFGSDLTIGLCHIGHGNHVPEEVYLTGAVQSLENSAIDCATLLNDLFSYQKEIEYEGEVHNAVLVVQNFFGVDYPTGMAIVADLMHSRMRQFQHVAAHELPQMYEDLDLDDGTRKILDGHVKELENWLAGILNWHRGVKRYREEDLRAGSAAPWRLNLPTGQGTSAAQVVSLMARAAAQAAYAARAQPAVPEPASAAASAVST